MPIRAADYGVCVLPLACGLGSDRTRVEKPALVEGLQVRALPQTAAMDCSSSRAIPLPVTRLKPVPLFAFFRKCLLTEGFQEIHTPKTIGGASEGGASVFKLNYMGRCQPSVLIDAA